MAKRGAKEKNRRQVVMIIVEGQSDENALAVPLTEAFEKKYGPDVNVLFAKIKNEDDTEGGDITSRTGVVPEKLQMLMNKLIIMPCLEDYSLMPKYITEIVHIIDMDGAYISDDKIILNPDAEEHPKPVYRDETIWASDPQKIVERNDRKRKNIEALLRFNVSGFDIQNYCETERGNKPTTKAYRVPYSVYCFSCNLDHFTCGDPNLDRFQKIKCADAFAREHGNDLESFTTYLYSNSSTAKGVGYSESWEFIKRDGNSLKCFTNINLLFDAILNFEVMEEQVAG